MSVDNPSSGDNTFSNAALNQLLFQAAQNQQLGYNFSSPLGATLVGAYTRDQVLGTLADQLAQAPGTASIVAKNGLFRMNWFDGRFLTAQAFKLQDTYWDQRLRLLAQIFPPGISWGLGIGGLPATLQPYPPPGDDIGYTRSGGVSLDQAFTLQPGVAFDGIGRPIVVGQEFNFCFRDLVTRFQSEPRQVAASGQQFQSCMCLEPFNGGAGTPGSAVPPGPYLLMIEPRESPEGDAKVYGEACAGDQPARCQSNGWRGGFGLSLVRFPADPPNDSKIGSAWDLRGTLSAYYYDVFEHSLISRWDPEFARDDAFCDASGPACQQAGAIPLAMAYIGFDGSVLFLDQWIPRRGLAATQAATWTLTHIGAPPQAAALARLHQFQCMLKQSLQTVPLIIETAQTTFQGPNLYQRGFRHIPPVGFLPFKPRLDLEARDKIGDVAGTTATAGIAAIFRLGPAIGLMLHAQRQVGIYFRNTNVIPYYVVALHDDDVLEDFNNAFHKDPVRIASSAKLDDSFIGVNDSIGSVGRASLSLSAFTNFVIAFRAIMKVLMEDLDLLVNRDVEIVKVILPLQGLRRRHPIVGVSESDSRSSLQDWLRPYATDKDGRFSETEFDRLVSLLRDNFGVDSLPRHFAVYVKQRLVLLDAIYYLFALLNQVKEFSEIVVSESVLNNQLSVGVIRQQHQSKPAHEQAAVQAALATPVVREALAESALAANPDLASPQLWDAYFERVDEEEARLADQIDDPVLRRERALELVADALGNEVPGFAPLRLLVAVQGADQAEASLRTVQRAAVAKPALDNRGRPRQPNLSIDVLHSDRLRVFERAGSQEIWRAFRSGLGQQPANKVVSSVAADTRVEELLNRPADEAEVLIGGREELDKIRTAIRPKVDKIAKEIDAIAVNPPAPNVVESFNKNLQKADGDSVKALAATQKEFRTDAEASATLKRIKPMADLLGPDGFEPVAAVVFRQPG